MIVFSRAINLEDFTRDYLLWCSKQLEFQLLLVFSRALFIQRMEGLGLFRIFFDYWLKLRGSFCWQSVVFLDFFWNGSSQTEITQLNLAILVHEYIPGLYISVHDSSLMNQIDCAKNIVDDCDNVLFSKLHFVRHIQYLVQIFVFVVHDQKHII